jgi:RHS repeat-associated protein
LGELEISYQRNAEVEMKNVYLFANGKILLEAEVKGVSRDWDDDYVEDYRWDRRKSIKIKDQIYFHQDVLGSTIYTADERGSKERHVEYDAYGQLLSRRVESREFLYNGKQFNDQTKLYNYGFRDYNASTARFTTVDPIRDGDNWFVYVGGEPVGRVDLWGLESDSCDDCSNGWNENADGTYTIMEGGSRWALSEQVYGTGIHYENFIPINGGEVDDSRIQIGTTFVNKYDQILLEKEILLSPQVGVEPELIISDKSVWQSWIEKETGEELTQSEANLQVTIGGVEMVAGGALIPTGKGTVPGLFIMADGAHMVGEGLNERKAMPLDMYLKLVNPVIETGNETVTTFTSPF